MMLKGKQDLVQQWVLENKWSFETNRACNIGNHCLRVDSDEAAASKVFIEFVALIIRNRIYNYLKDAAKEMPKTPNYMTVTAAIRELEKIEMSRQLDGIYRFDHAITATQKTIFKAFDLTDANVKYRANEISKILDKEEAILNENLLKAFARSDKTYDEVMVFMGADKDGE